MASGADWAWLRCDAGVVHLTEPRGPRGPLTTVVDRIPVLTPGDRVALDLSRAVPWHTPPPPQAVSSHRVAAACAAVRAHAWNDPRAWRLETEPLDEVAADLMERGPGLTPAGADAITGFVYTTTALTPRSIAPFTSIPQGEPTRSLLAVAFEGEAFDSVAAILAAVLRADGPALAPAIRRLTALGRTTGRAYLTGVLCALNRPGGPASVSAR